jgi:DHA2 family multidrug resistance protein
MAEKGFTKWIIIVTVISASLLELIDTTVVNVALTQMMGNLGATLEDVAWVVTAYGVANVIILPMTGWLSAKFGRTNYFAFSIILFTVASLFCGTSTTIWELAAFRFVQGLGGGALLSTSQAILYETFEPEERGMATALFGLGVVIGPTIGPTLGGYMVDHYSWPWIFFINIPLGIIATILTITYIKDSTHNHRKIDSVDWWGIILLVVCIGSLQIVLERGETEDWFATPYIVVLSIASVLAGIIFVWHELRSEHPVVDLRILKDRNLSIGMVFTFILGFGLYSSVFVFPIFCQNLLGMTAQQTGILLIPSGLITLFIMPTIGIMMKKGVSPILLSAFGMIIFFLFTFILSKSTLASGTGDFLVPLLLRGIGMGFLFVPLTALALGGLAPKDIPQGTGLNNMMRQLGGSFGIAIMTTFISYRVAFHRTTLIEKVTAYSNEVATRVSAFTANFISKGFTANEAKQMAYKAIDGTVTRQSVLMSYMDSFFIIGVFFLCLIPFLIFQRKPKVLVTDAGH